MKSTIFTSRAARLVRTGLGGCLLFVVALSVAYSRQQREVVMHPPPPPPVKKVQLPVEPGAVEVAFTDGSNLKMLLRDDKIALATPHGKLLIAVTDIQRIEFATRISEEDDKRVRVAVADLGDTEFRKREGAGVTLLKLGGKAYPALLRAAEQKDPEVVRRAKELIQQVTASVPAEYLTVRKNDVVYTADSTIAGRIEAASLKAHTSQFGAVQVKLADARSLRSQALGPVLPSSTAVPGTMYPPPGAMPGTPVMPAPPPPGIPGGAPQPSR